jgi:tRNA threonylcarbamoyl adenosine modification protein YeaZ
MQYLAIDTTTQEIKLALYNSTINKSFELIEFVGRKQSETLHIKIKELIESANITIADINTIVVNTGPGSYTSLRLGIATAKGLALPFNINVIGVDSFTLIKELYSNNKNQAIILENSEKQLYLDNSKEQLIIEPEELANHLEQNQEILGSGFELYKDYLTNYKLIEKTDTIKPIDLINYVINNKIKDSNLEPLYIKPLSYKKYEYKL